METEHAQGNEFKHQQQHHNPFPSFSLPLPQHSNSSSLSGDLHHPITPAVRDPSPQDHRSLAALPEALPRLESTDHPLPTDPAPESQDFDTAFERELEQLIAMDREAAEHDLDAFDAQPGPSRASRLSSSPLLDAWSEAEESAFRVVFAASAGTDSRILARRVEARLGGARSTDQALAFYDRITKSLVKMTKREDLWELPLNRLHPLVAETVRLTHEQGLRTSDLGKRGADKKRRRRAIEGILAAVDALLGGTGAARNVSTMLTGGTDTSFPTDLTPGLAAGPPAAAPGPGPRTHDPVASCASEPNAQQHAPAVDPGMALTPAVGGATPAARPAASKVVLRLRANDDHTERLLQAGGFQPGFELVVKSSASVAKVFSHCAKKFAAAAARAPPGARLTLIAPLSLAPRGNSSDEAPRPGGHVFAPTWTEDVCSVSDTRVADLESALVEYNPEARSTNAAGEVLLDVCFLWAPTALDLGDSSKGVGSALPAANGAVASLADALRTSERAGGNPHHAHAHAHTHAAHPHMAHGLPPGYPPYGYPYPPHPYYHHPMYAHPPPPAYGHMPPPPYGHGHGHGHASFTAQVMGAMDPYGHMGYPPGPGYGPSAMPPFHAAAPPPRFPSGGGLAPAALKRPAGPLPSAQQPTHKRSKDAAGPSGKPASAAAAPKSGAKGKKGTGKKGGTGAEVLALDPLPPPGQDSILHGVLEAFNLELPPLPDLGAENLGLGMMDAGTDLADLGLSQLFAQLRSPSKGTGVTPKRAGGTSAMDPLCPLHPRTNSATAKRTINLDDPFRDIFSSKK